MPERLSPSRTNDYITCPRLFYYKTILGMPTPPSEATVKGNLAHYAFEHIFDHEPAERTPEVAFGYVDKAWEEMSKDPQVVEVVSNPDFVLRAAKRTVESWFLMERVHNFDPKETLLPGGKTIDGRELHVEGPIGTVNFHGFIDRFDSWETKEGTKWAISDYKTGKVPNPRFIDKYWFQLRVYAYVVEESLKVRPSLLRLVFTSAGSKDGIFTFEVTPQTQQGTKTQVETIWKGMQKSLKNDVWETKKGPLCQWCHFKNICPAWNTEIIIDS